MNQRIPYRETEIPESQWALLRALSDDALAELALTDANLPPVDIVTAIRTYIEDHRRDASISEDEDLIFMLGVLWGDQVCRAYSWQWVTLEELIPGGARFYTVVSPDRRFRSDPFAFIKKFLDNPRRVNTVILAFNMLRLPDMPDVQPGRYMNLG